MIKFLSFVCLLVLVTPLTVSGQNRIVISKLKRELYVLNQYQDTLCVMRCGLGSNLGNKARIGDRRTPEGVFAISNIHDSRTWTHDFKDGNGRIPGAYGPWFIRLAVPMFKGIGIHGTCFPNSIGTRCSEGCIRLHNKDIEKLIGYIKVGDKVEIKPEFIN